MKLAEVQLKLKAPKGQMNNFGKYKYRSAEDILEALKPLLNGEAIVTLSDEMVLIGDRYYVKATATFEGDDVKTVTAFAREEETKKGMDGSQITGASSSYARKYALNGLFLIDDTKDSDFTNTHDKDDGKPETMSYNTPKETKKFKKEVLDKIANSESVYDLEAIWNEMDESDKALYKGKVKDKKAQLNG